MTTLIPQPTEDIPPDDGVPFNDGSDAPLRNGHDKTARDWQPPGVTSYGAGFDPAAIPLRQWVLGRRRARGEVTIDAGPPGVNKSTLMLTDAVAIVTGRKILADEVHESGEVLYLAGEDSRRDVEARLAGILAYYHIRPEELADKLHAVYLGEIDSVDYTLAQMRDDMAVLNTDMVGWLREFPNVTAVFIDPIAAWHQLIENSNEALQLLSSGLRSIAVRGKRHVGFDHHVNKIAMSDPEAHVGNLAAMRGASAIGAAVRWAFTMAKLKAETAVGHGIPESERRCYRRLDALKASYGPDDDEVRLIRVESVEIANGEPVGVLVEVDMQRTRQAAELRKADADKTARTKLTAAFTHMLAEKTPRSASNAAIWLTQHYPDLFRNRKTGEPLAEFTLRRQLPALIGKGLDTTCEGRYARIVVSQPEREGKGLQIGFEEPISR